MCESILEILSIMKYFFVGDRLKQKKPFLFNLMLIYFLLLAILI